MSESPEPDVGRDYYAALMNRSVEGVEALLDPDVMWHVPGKHSRAGTYQGRDQVMGLFDGFSRANERTIEVEDVLSGECFVMVLVRVVKRNGKTFGGRYVHVMRTRSGRIVESWHFDEDQSRLDELLQSET
jgi:ketosteroid isomerase-like protein